MKEREEAGNIVGWVKLGVGEWVAGRVSALGGVGSRMGEWAAIQGAVKYAKVSGVTANQEERISLNRSLAAFGLRVGDVVMIKCTERLETGFRRYKVWDVAPAEILAGVAKAGGDPASVLVSEAARLWEPAGDAHEEPQPATRGEVDDDLPF